MDAFLQDLLDRGEAGLQALCDRRQQEHVGLEFKTKRTPTQGDEVDPIGWTGIGVT